MKNILKDIIIVTLSVTMLVVIFIPLLIIIEVKKLFTKNNNETYHRDSTHINGDYLE